MELSKAKNIKYNGNDAMAVAKNNVVRWKRGEDKIIVTVNTSSDKISYVVCSDAFAEAVNNSVLLTDEKNRLTGRVFIPNSEGEYRILYIYKDSVDFNGNFDDLDIDGIEIYDGINVGTITFDNNTTIKAVYVAPKALEGVDDYSYMFRNTKALRSVNTADWNIGEGSTDYMFYTSGIEEVDLGDAVSIGARAFYSTPIKKVKSSNVKYIGERAFFRCSGLTEFDFSNVEEIGNQAFIDTRNDVTIPLSTVLNLPNIKKVGAYGLGYIGSSVIHIGDKVNELDYMAFRSNNGSLIPNLNYVTVEQPTPFDLSCFDFMGAEGENNVSVYVPHRSYEGYLDAYAFSRERAEIMLSKGTFVRYESTDGGIITPNDNYLYASSKYIIFAGEVRDISDKMYQSLDNLKSLYLEDIESIGMHSFWGCDALETLVIDSVVPPNLIDTTAFHGTNCTIYVPDESVNAYRTATNWSYIADKIKSISEKDN